MLSVVRRLVVSRPQQTSFRSAIIIVTTFSKLVSPHNPSYPKRIRDFAKTHEITFFISHFDYCILLLKCEPEFLLLSCLSIIYIYIIQNPQ